MAEDISSSSLDFDQIARDAADDYRCIEGLIWEMNASWENSTESYQYILRFIQLHKSFYANVVLLTLESWDRDFEYESNIQEEQSKLIQLAEMLTKDASFLTRIIAKYKLESWSEYFAQCVSYIIDDWAIDTDCHQIVYCPSEESN